MSFHKIEMLIKDSYLWTLPPPPPTPFHLFSQEDAPCTHATPSEIASTLNISETSVRRIIKDDLQLVPFKKIRTQRLSQGNIQKRIERCPKILRQFDKKSLDRAFFSDEKIFKVEQLYEPHNQVVYAPKGTMRMDIEDDRIYVERSGFNDQIMVSVAVSKLGKTSMFFVEPGAKVNGPYYRNHLLADMIPEMDTLANHQPYIFMQDGARSHTATETVEYLQSQQHLDLIAPNEWPPNSPDLNPVDFCIWGKLKTNVYRERRITSIEQLRAVLIEEWEKFPQSIIDNCIDAFRGRLRRVIECEGMHIENFYQ